MIFDVLTEPWMGVVDKETGEVLKVGLRDYIVNAHMYKCSAENKDFAIIRRLQQRLAEAVVVKSWKVEYFFNYEFKWDLYKLCELLPGLGDLIDHGIGFVDMEGNPFLLLQPYRGNPEEFRKKNKICRYVKVWKGGFHNPEAYAVVISGDFLTHLQTHIEDFRCCKVWKNERNCSNDEKLWLEHITRISDVHHGAK